VDVDQQLVRKSACGDRLADVRFTNVPLPDAYLTEGSPDGSVGEVPTSSCAAGEEIVIVFGLGSCSCLVRFLYSNLLISDIDHYTQWDVFGLLRVYLIHLFCIGLLSFIVLWDIAHAAFLQLLAWQDPPCDGVVAQ
jgi:hypothetical protein